MTNLPALAQGGGEVGFPAALSDAVASARDYMLADTAESTRRAYAADFRDFSAWSAGHGLEPLPAPVGSVAAYLASLADKGLKVSTITRRAAAIAYAHRQAGHEPPTNAEPIKAVLRGIRRRIGVAVERKAPATARAISTMLRKVPDDRLGKRDKALLLLGFAAALRRSELVALKVSDIQRTPEGVLVHIRRSKTDQTGAGHVVAVPRGNKLRPVEALDEWLAFAGIREGLIFDLTPQSVALIVKRRCEAAKLDPKLFSGHSLRAGFVTSACESGADLFKIMDVTRHTDPKTVRVYDRQAKAFANHASKGFM